MKLKKGHKAILKLLLSLTLLFNFAFSNIDDDIKIFVKDFKYE